MACGVQGLADYKFPIWFEFGIHEDETIDIADSGGDILSGVLKAEGLDAAARFNRLQAMLVEVGTRLNEIDPEGFRKIWGEI